MAAVRLTYLDFRGRAELLRFTLSQAGVEFQDKRVKPEQWAEEVPGQLLLPPRYFALSSFLGTPFGIPVLECEGEVLKSNATIAKFLANKYSEIFGL